MYQDIVVNYYKGKFYGDYDDDDYDDYDIKKVYVDKKYYDNNNECPAQSDTIQLKGKIPPKGVIIIAYYDPCELDDGRATFNIPENDHLKLAFLSIDTDGSGGDDHDGVLVDLEKVQSLQKNNGLYRKL